ARRNGVHWPTFLAVASLPTSRNSCPSPSGSSSTVRSMNPPKVLIADSISQRGVDELSRDNALEVSAKTGLSEADLVKIIPDFSAIVVRSQTKVTGAILNAATRLRVIGRAGVRSIPFRLARAQFTSRAGGRDR